jgi:hypothetical protein
MRPVASNEAQTDRGFTQMSDTTRDSIDLRAVLARIDRDLAEQSKLRAESDKFASEQRKLNAEAAKLDRDRAFLPWTIAATLLGAGAALFAAGAGFIKLIGG